MTMKTVASVPMARDLSSEQGRRVREAMKAYQKANNLNDTAFAKLLGRSQPAIRKIVVEDGNPSFGTAQRFAALTSVNVLELMGPRDEDGDMSSSSDDTRDPEPGDVDETDPYPNRAIAIARLRGVVSSEAIVYVRGIELKASAPPTVEEWCEDLLVSSRRLRRTGEPVALGSRRADESDDEP